jgi:hypothetical protein
VSRSSNWNAVRISCLYHACNRPSSPSVMWSPLLYSVKNTNYEDNHLCRFLPICLLFRTL